MPLDLGDYASALAPALGLIAEAGVEPLHVVRRATDRALEQICDPLLKDLIGGQSDGVLEGLRLQELVDLRVGQRLQTPCENPLR
jgi:hypothetical protein